MRITSTAKCLFVYQTFTVANVNDIHIHVKAIYVKVKKRIRRLNYTRANTGLNSMNKRKWRQKYDVNVTPRLL